MVGVRRFEQVDVEIDPGVVRECLEELLDQLERGEIDLVTFTSSSTVTNFVDAIPVDRREAIEMAIRLALGSQSSPTQLACK